MTRNPNAEPICIHFVGGVLHCDIPLPDAVHPLHPWSDTPRSCRRPEILPHSGFQQDYWARCKNLHYCHELFFIIVLVSLLNCIFILYNVSAIKLIPNLSITSSCLSASLCRWWFRAWFSASGIEWYNQSLGFKTSLWVAGWGGGSLPLAIWTCICACMTVFMCTFLWEASIWNNLNVSGKMLHKHEKRAN